jgi:hypothetical protein
VYHDKKIGSLLILAIACFVVACDQRSPGPVAAEGRVQNVTYPTRLTNINGWHGIQVAKPKVNIRGVEIVECHLSFPADFGSTQDEKNLLVHLVSQRSEINDKDCQFSPVGAYQALDQLLRLVVAKQDTATDRLLLNRGTTEMPFNLDGEMLEGYTESYLVPVLEKYEKLDTVLDQARESVIAKSICVNLQRYDDMKNPIFKKRIQVLVKRLNAKGMGRFAREIESCDLSHPPAQ